MSYQDYANYYEGTKQRATGVTYFLVHGRKGKVNVLRLAERLEGITKKIPFKLGFGEDDVIIPDIFKKNGELVVQSKIDRVAPMNDGSLFGKATIDAPIRIWFRGQKLLIIGTTEIYFIIFREESSKNYFLTLLTSRYKSRELYSTLSENLKQFGLVTIPSKIEQEDIQEITKRLKGKLKFTLVGNYPTNEITKKAIWGNDYENNQSYKDDIEEGKIYQNQFQFVDTVRNEKKVITVSEDGLIRFYNNISYQEMEWFIRKEIVPFLKQAEKPKIPVLTGFTFEDLFTDDV
jgi:hypothetical protein